MFYYIDDLNYFEVIPHENDIPTPEEYVRYVVEKLASEGREDLLRR